MQQQQYSQPQQQDQGSFVLGLTVGLFAGAASYFLFATSEGEKARKELMKEWSSAKSQLDLKELQNFDTQNPVQSVKGMVRSAISSIVGSDWVSEPESLTTAKPKRAKKPSSTQKFKGV